MSYISDLRQIVFTPKDRRQVLKKNVRRQIYMLIYKQLLKYRCYVHRIGGMEDHIHILLEMPSTVQLSTMLQVVKQETSKKIGILIPFWEGWQDGFFSKTYEKGRDLQPLIEYIKNQEKHHQGRTFAEEYSLMTGRPLSDIIKDGKWWW